MSTGGNIFSNFLELYIIKTDFFAKAFIGPQEQSILYFADADILSWGKKNVCFKRILFDGIYKSRSSFIMLFVKIK